MAELNPGSWKCQKPDVRFRICCAKFAGFLVDIRWLSHGNANQLSELMLTILKCAAQYAICATNSSWAGSGARPNIEPGRVLLGNSVARQVIQ